LHQEHGPRGFSFELEEAPARAADLGRLDLDWSDLAAAAPEPTRAQEEVSVPPAANLVAMRTGTATPLMPHAVAARTAAPSRSLLAAFSPARVAVPDRPTTDQPSIDPPPAARDSAASAAAAVATPEAFPASPQVRRLRFPVSAAPQLKPSPRPSTRFADSVGRVRPPADSVGDLLLLDQSTPPEDLPTRSDPPRGTEDDPRPEPALLLRRAGVLFASAKDTALDLGGRGLESGRVLAHQMSDALRERLERKAVAPPDGPSQAPQPEPTAEAAQRAPQLRAFTERRSLIALGRQGGGPLLALVAALGMFLGSRHILGSGGIGLSKTGANVPNLGAVSRADGGSRTSKPMTGAASDPAAGQPAAPPPAMMTEVVPLPAGMAWPGKGLLEVVTSEDELVYVDGVFTGRGPLRRVPVTPGEHEVSIRKEGSERHGTAEVEPNRTTRAVFRGK